MKRSYRGIFYSELSSLRMHLHLNFQLDFKDDYWANYSKTMHLFLNEKSAKSTLVRALHDIG